MEKNVFGKVLERLFAASVMGLLTGLLGGELWQIGTNPFVAYLVRIFGEWAREVMFILCLLAMLGVAAVGVLGLIGKLDEEQKPSTP